MTKAPEVKPRVSRTLAKMLDSILNDEEFLASLPDLRINVLLKDAVLHATECDELSMESLEDSDDVRTITLEQLQDYESKGEACPTCSWNYTAQEPSMSHTERLEIIWGRMSLFSNYEEQIEAETGALSSHYEVIGSADNLLAIEDEVCEFLESAEPHEWVRAKRLRKALDDKFQELHDACNTDAVRQSLIMYAASQIAKNAAESYQVSFRKLSSSPVKLDIDKRYAEEMTAHWESLPDYVIVSRKGNSDSWGEALDIIERAWPATGSFWVLPCAIHQYYTASRRLSSSVTASILVAAEPSAEVMDIIETLCVIDGKSLSEAYKTAVRL